MRLAVSTRRVDASGLGSTPTAGSCWRSSALSRASTSNMLSERRTRRPAVGALSPGASELRVDGHDLDARSRGWACGRGPAG